MSEQAIKIDVDNDGIATLTIDVPGESMNVINEQFLDDIEAHVNTISSDEAIKGAILTSGKASGFMAGADLRMIGAMIGADKQPTLEEIFEACYRLNRILRQMETCGKPVVAAVNGMALGGGLEVVLACHHRIVVNNPKIQLGQPEVMVGIIPGGGATQRFTRLAGVQVALQYLTTGKNMSPAEAVGLGLLHEAVDADKLMTRAKEWLLDRPISTQPWDKRGYKIPGGGGAMHPGAVRTFMGASAMAQDKSMHNYPAVQMILSAVYEGSIVPMDVALRIESKYFSKALLTPEAKGMVRTLFINKMEAERGRGRPKDIEKQTCKKLGMLGAGMMGAGIAYVSAKVGMEVVLLDMSQDGADKGKAYSENLCEKGVKRGKVTREKADELLARIKTTTDFADLEGCDLIIEAVFEDRTIKADVTAKAEAVMPKDAIFASNTSTLPITGLAEAFTRPEDFIGIHFFSPVDKMPLVEIILGEKTGDKAIAVALDYVGQIKKTPIVVNDSRGFYTSRCFGTYVMEGAAMLAEGVNPALIENGGKLAGMPVGPLAVGDEVSIELSHKVMTATRNDLGDKYMESPGDAYIEKMVELGRMGRKNGKGAYDYPEGGKKHLWAGLADHFPRADHQPDIAEVKTRFLYRQAVEAARCMEEGVLRDIPSGDVGAIFGWGFAPMTGGPMSFMDQIGLPDFVREADRLAQQYGERFAPPKLLRDMAAKGESFYS